MCIFMCGKELWNVWNRYFMIIISIRCTVRYCFVHGKFDDVCLFLPCTYSNFIYLHTYKYTYNTESTFGALYRYTKYIDSLNRILLLLLLLVVVVLLLLLLLWCIIFLPLNSIPLYMLFILVSIWNVRRCAYKDIAHEADRKTVNELMVSPHCALF